MRVALTAIAVAATLTAGCHVQCREPNAHLPTRWDDRLAMVPRRVTGASNDGRLLAETCRETCPACIQMAERGDLDSCYVAEAPTLRSSPDETFVLCRYRTAAACHGPMAGADVRPICPLENVSRSSP